MPDPTQASGLFWATVFGAALGVIAGTVIQYVLTFALDRRSRAHQKKALVKELTYNRSLVDELVQEAKKLRNAVNGDVLSSYSGYFSFGKGLFAQAHAATISGMLYDFLSIEDIKNAQKIVYLLSNTNENWVNNEISKRRALSADSQRFDRAEAVRFVDFIEEQLSDLVTRIEQLIGKLQ